MSTLPICNPDQIRRDWLGRAVAAAGMAVVLGVVVLHGADNAGDRPAGPTRLDDSSAVAPAVNRAGDGDETAPSPVLDEPLQDWRDIPLFSADDPAAPPIDKASDRVLVVTSVGELTELFDDLGYDHELVRDLGVAVPRIYLSTLPGDLNAGAHAGERPDLFINALLPMLLRVNEAVTAERARVEALSGLLAEGGALAPEEQAELERLATDYGLDSEAPPEDLVAALLVRVDEVPVSLALAQAAVESGWGTSSLARNGNALFGQTGSVGIRASSGHTYAAFDGLLEAVEAYVHNLNTHGAYADFRALRADLRTADQPLDGLTLAQGLHAYSELGGEYIRYISGLIRSYELSALDGARLADPADPADRTPAAI